MKRIRKNENYQWQDKFYEKVVRIFAKAVASGDWNERWAAIHRDSDRSQISINKVTHDRLKFLHDDTGKSRQVIFETACVHYRSVLKKMEAEAGA